MQSGAPLAASVLLLVSAGFLSAGCGSSDKNPASSSLNGARGGSGGSGNGGTGGSSTGGSGGTTTINLTGGSSGTSGASGTSGGSAGGDTCGGDNYDAVLVPLDLYVMLDRSSSMLDAVNGSTKWDAITQALTTFIADPASSGIGIGLQFFPQHDPNVPDTCNTSTDCGANNPCLKNFCQNAGPKFYICDTNADCVDSTGANLGPCTPLTYCWTSHGSQLCHNDNLECNGVAGDCVPFNQCSRDTTYSCKSAGTTCGSDMGKNLGTCQAVASAVCQHTSDCRDASYAVPAAEIAALPGAASALEGVLTSTSPVGDTPTSPALGGALSHARAWATAHPDHKVAVLLATDGLPSDCMLNETNADPYGITEVSTTASTALAASPSIKTFVIGVFAPADTDSPGNLNQIAHAGGTDMAYIVNTGASVADQFLSALDAIRGASLPCEFQIPTPSSGGFDSSLVNVVFTSGGQDQTLYYWKDAASCDATSGGWYYDNASAPTKIIACPASCTQFEGASNGHVAIRLGCRSVVK